MRRRQLAPGKRELRLDRDRRLELADGGAYSIPGKPVEMRNAESIGVDGARVDRPHPVVCQSVALLHACCANALPQCLGSQVD